MKKNAFLAFWATCVCLILGSSQASAANDDVVLYAADVASMKGNWARAADPTAAGGQLLTSADRGWGNTNNPSASPADFVEFSFTAAAGTPYHIWLRLRAGANSKYNDSVYVQFSDAIDAKDRPLFRIGTTKGLVVNLQSCDGCPLNGWGWMDTAYWLSQNTTVRFATGGSHTVRIQTREDGVSLDQVVLSPITYRSVAPGQVMGDATIVPHPAAPQPTPYTGTPMAVPGTIAAENFDNGGEGVAYHDTRTGNDGGAYRQTDVDIQPSDNGGYNIGWISVGEWLSYSVDVASAGAYIVEAQVAASGQGGTFHVDFNGINVTGPLTIPNSGDWQNWTTVSKLVTLAAGKQSMRVTFDAAGEVVGNLKSIRITTAAATPYSGAPVTLPGVVSPEKFDNGGEGLAYHDTTSGNSGGAVRQTDVDLEASGAGGYDVGWTADGEWLSYAVNVTVGGGYLLKLRVASPASTGQLHVAFGANSTTTVAVPNTGDWQAWTTISIPVTLSAGVQSMKVVVDKGGFNFGTITVDTAGIIISAPPPPPSTPTVPTVITVAAGGNLQAAIDAALPGDTIVLQAGATFTGNFTLPVKTGESYITIRSSAADSALPGANARISPAYASQLPKIVSPNSAPALATLPGAHHYRLFALEFGANYHGIGDIITLGDGSSAQNSLSMVPKNLIVDRVYIHGDVTYGQKRAIGLNSGTTAIINSYITEIKADGQDSQAIAGWNGTGPYTISNNYLEAAGENILIGGADPGIPNLIPSDITISQNYLTKQLAWRTQLQWNVKNLLELKNAQRVVIDGNLLEYSWQAAQSGYAVVFTPRNQDGTAPWSVVQQVQFTNNIVRHVAAGVNILGLDDEHPSQLTNNIVVRNNLFDDISARTYGGDGRFVLINGGANITFDHNTVMQDGWTALYADGVPTTGFVFTNNIIPDYSWAIMGGDASPGNGTIAAYFPGSIFSKGVFAGAPASSYPAGNYYPIDLASVGFVDLANRNYRLALGSPYRNAATDGSDVGCNVDAVIAATGEKY
jgi:Carbohydrate binding module (family 6)